MSEISPIEHFICGGFSGICTVLVGHPFDTIKVRLQTMAHVYSGTVDCVRKTLTNEGILGFYKGMGAPLVSVAPTFAMSFMGYGIGKKIFCSNEKEKITYVQHLCAGAFSGIFFSMLLIPTDRIKCLLQIQHGKSKLYHGPVDCAVQLLKNGGIRSLFRGTGATLLREIPASGSFFVTYEIMMDLVAADRSKGVNIRETIVSGGVAGLVYWVVAMPPDVLKSRLQTAPDRTYPKGVRDVFKSLMQNEGPLALYKGVTPVFIRAFPANATCFLSFEICKQFILYLKSNKDNLF